MADDKNDNDPDKNKGKSGGKNEGGGDPKYIGGGGAGDLKDPEIPNKADVGTLNFEQILFLIAGVGKDLHHILEVGSKAEGGWLKFVQGADSEDGAAAKSGATGSPAITYTAIDNKVWFEVNYNDDLLGTWGQAVSTTDSYMKDLATGNVGTISVQRLLAAYRMIAHYQKWLTDATATSAAHLKNIDSPDSEFKGRAAYAIQGQVRQINFVLNDIRTKLAGQKPAEEILNLATALSEFGRTMAKLWHDAHANIKSVISDALQAYITNVRTYIRGIGIVRGYPNYVLDNAAAFQDDFSLRQYINEVLSAYDSEKFQQSVGFTYRGAVSGFDRTDGMLTWTPSPLPAKGHVHGDLRSAGVWGVMNRNISNYVRENVLDPMESDARAAAAKLAKAFKAAEVPLKPFEVSKPPTIGNAPGGGGPVPPGGDGGDKKPPPFNPPGGDDGGGDRKKPPPLNPPGGDGGDHKPPPIGGDNGDHKPPPLNPPGGDDGGGEHKPPPVGGDGGDHKPPPFNPPGGDDGGGGHKPPPLGGDGGPNDRVNQNFPDPDGNLSVPDDPFVKDPNGQGDGAPPPFGPFGNGPGGNGPGGNGPDLNRRSLGNGNPDGNDGGDGWSPDNPWDKVGENNPWDRINNELDGHNPGGNDHGGDRGLGGDKDHLPGNPPGEHKNPGGEDGWSPDDAWDRINKEIGGNHPGDGNGDLHVPPPGGGHGPGNIGGDEHFSPPGGASGNEHFSPPGGVGGSGAGTGPGGAGGGSGFAGEGWSDWSGQLGGGSGGPGGGGGEHNQGAPPGGGMPMMPPMGGMGGGMGGMGGGGGGGGGRDRERQTWLSEDEEIWGADVDLGSGVIGRPDGGPRVTDDVPLPTHVHTPSKPSSSKGKRDKADKRTAATDGTTQSTEPEAPPNPVDAAESVEQVKAPAETGRTDETRAEGSA